MKPEIPYEEIDVEIRRLVRLVHAVPGIQSISSCAGHDSDAEAVVSFRASKLEAIAQLARALPWHGIKPGLVGGRPTASAILLVARHCKEFGLVHDLRLSGWPQAARWDLIGRVEQRLMGLTRSEGSDPEESES